MRCSATSFIHSSIATSAFLTPRGHSRSTNMRVPSLAAGAA